MMPAPHDDTIGTALRAAAARLAHEPAARLEAELLLAEALGCERTTLHAWPERTLPAGVRERFEDLLARRAAGEPVAYLLGRREFYGLELVVTPATLIPRPETELLVDEALARMPADARWTVADLGTGSGAVALAIARARPRCTVVATDADPAALAVARANAARLELANVRFVRGHWLAALGRAALDMVVSNPPYVAEDDPHLGRGDLRFEPRHALAAGPDGLDALRAIISGAPAVLAPDGWLLVEHGADQRGAVLDLLARAGFGETVTAGDLAGLPRVAGGRLQAAE